MRRLLILLLLFVAVCFGQYEEQNPTIFHVNAEVCQMLRSWGYGALFSTCRQNVQVIGHTTEPDVGIIRVVLEYDKDGVRTTQTKRADVDEDGKFIVVFILEDIENPEATVYQFAAVGQPLRYPLQE